MKIVELFSMKVYHLAFITGKSNLELPQNLIEKRTSSIDYIRQQS